MRWRSVLALELSPIGLWKSLLLFGRATNAGGSGAEHAITHVIIVVGTVGGVELVDSYAKDGTYSDPSAPESDSTDLVITDTILSFISAPGPRSPLYSLFGLTPLLLLLKR